MIALRKVKFASQVGMFALMFTASAVYAVDSCQNELSVKFSESNKPVNLCGYGTYTITNLPAAVAGQASMQFQLDSKTTLSFQSQPQSGFVFTHPESGCIVGMPYELLCQNVNSIQFQYQVPADTKTNYSIEIFNQTANAVVITRQ